MTGWALSRVAGAPAGVLHALEADLVSAPVDRRVRVVEPDGPAVVLGSTEPEAHADAARAAAAGVAVARRRSGGSAVLVGPGRCLWVDVVVPAGDPLWLADVGRAAWWLGDAFAAALTAVGVAGPRVHRTGMERSAWSDRVCFAGRGPGEVFVDGAKVVGVSQRRTRHGALFQCSVPLAVGPGLTAPWDPTELLDVLALAPAERERAAAELTGAAVALRADVDLVGALLAVLPGA